MEAKAGFWEAAKGFIGRYKMSLILSYGIVLAAFFVMLFNDSLQIDEETWVMGNGHIGLWLMQGRFGLYFFDKIFCPTGSFIPGLWDFAAVTLWTLAGAVFVFCISLILKKDMPSFSVFAFCTIFSTVRLSVGDLLSFSMFNLQQALAMLLMSMASLCSVLFFVGGKKRWMMPAAGLIFCAVGFFQAFAVVYITFIAIYLWLLVNGTQARPFKTIALQMIYAVFAFTAGLLLYFGINSYITTYVAPGGGKYLSDSYIGWHDGFSFAMDRTMGNIGDILLGKNDTGGVSMLIPTVLLVLFILLSALRAKGVKNKLLAVLSGCFVGISPFILSLFTAMPNIVGRTLLALPLAQGAVMLFSIQTLKNKRLRGAACALAAVVVLHNVFLMNGFFYSGLMAYKQDVNLGNLIMSTVTQELGSFHDKHMVFIGKYSAPPIPFRQEPVAASFFEYDEGNIQRMNDFLIAEGYAIKQSTAQQRQRAYEAAEDMACWPEEGSIAALGDIIIVKFSEVPQDSIWFRVNLVQ